MSDNRGCREGNDDKIFFLVFSFYYTNEYITNTLHIRINDKRNGEPEGDDGLFKSMYFFLSSLFFLD